MARADTCFHCALPIPANCDIRVEIGGEQQPVCCPGCKAVATLIRDAGLESYYDSRERPEPGAVRPADDVGEWEVFDREDMLAAFATREGDKAEATVYVGGMYCAACSWLIDAALRKLPGIASADINPATHRLRVTWDTSTVGLGRILATLADLGYKPQPLAPDSTERPERAEQRTALKRLLVASLGMMQVMMFAVALYSGEFQGIDADMERFLRLVSFLVTTPVVFCPPTGHGRAGIDRHRQRVCRIGLRDLHQRSCGLVRLGHHVRFLSHGRTLSRDARQAPFGRPQRRPGVAVAEHRDAARRRVAPPGTCSAARRRRYRAGSRRRVVPGGRFDH
jgi:copper chaperone CopZ